MPIWWIGKRREALTGNSEIYKKHIVQFLQKRGYYLKASSYVEATFADCILSKKDEIREYWVEAKATKISLGDSSFLLQLGKYLAEYVILTPSNRFKMILACYNIRNLRLFEQVFQKFESEAIEKTISNIVQVSQSNVRAIITKANSEDIRKFFEETTVIVANPAELQIAQEKIAPPVPTAPTLSDAEYAAEILSGFGDIEPLKGPDVTCLNLFELSTPEKLYIGETPYRTPKSIYREKPDVSFPSFHLESGKLYSFSEMNQDTLLGKFVDLNSVVAVDVKEFNKDENSQRIIVRILNKWIRNQCTDMGLRPNKRTRSYFFPKKSNDDNPVTVVWIPKSKRSKRELTKPMMTNGRINYWVHRAAEICARKFWGNYYVQIRPRWLFSSEGIYPFEGPRADRLDRAFRKSIYNRNLNQLYDVLFWYRYIFSEADVLGNFRLDNLTKAGREQLINVTEQVKVKSDRKPNVEFEEEVERLDTIESQQVSFFVKTLDEFV